jgi:hypothetical protein
MEEHVLDTWSSPSMHPSSKPGLVLPFASAVCDSETIVAAVEPVKFSTEK